MSTVLFMVVGICSVLAVVRVEVSIEDNVVEVDGKLWVVEDVVVVVSSVEEVVVRVSGVEEVVSGTEEVV